MFVYALKKVLNKEREDRQAFRDTRNMDEAQTVLLERFTWPIEEQSNKPSVQLDHNHGLRHFPIWSMAKVI